MIILLFGRARADAEPRVMQGLVITLMRLDISLMFLLPTSGQAPHSYNNHPIDLLATSKIYHRVIKLSGLPAFQAYPPIVFVRLVQPFLSLPLRARHQSQGQLGPARVFSSARPGRSPISRSLD